MVTPGTPSPFCPSANIQAMSTIRAGFMNSDGWRVNPPNSTHRVVAPLARVAQQRQGEHDRDGDQIDEEGRPLDAAAATSSTAANRAIGAPGCEDALAHRKMKRPGDAEAHRGGGAGAELE